MNCEFINQIYVFFLFIYCLEVSKKNCLHIFVYRVRYQGEFHFWWEIAEIFQLIGSWNCTFVTSF